MLDGTSTLNSIKQTLNVVRKDISLARISTSILSCRWQAINSNGRELNVSVSVISAPHFRAQSFLLLLVVSLGQFTLLSIEKMLSTFIITPSSLVLIAKQSPWQMVMPGNTSN